jgi:hypothetical protein
MLQRETFRTAGRTLVFFVGTFTLIAARVWTSTYIYPLSDMMRVCDEVEISKAINQ